MVHLLFGRVFEDKASLDTEIYPPSANWRDPEIREQLVCLWLDTVLVHTIYLSLELPHLLLFGKGVQHTPRILNNLDLVLAESEALRHIEDQILE